LGLPKMLNFSPLMLLLFSLINTSSGMQYTHRNILFSSERQLPVPPTLNARIFTLYL
jgi:hypothetical protein